MMIDALFRTISTRKGADPASSYTAALFAKGRQKIAQKLGEEAVETALAAMTNDSKAVAAESADLLYHLCVLWAHVGLTPDDIAAELARRENISGLDEKASRKE
jgi:phosphoribosyl-ATP pyrophosphohydrolase